MNDSIHNRLEDTRTLRSFEGKTIISQDNGKKIGNVEDVLIDPNHMKIEGILTSPSGIFRKKENVVPADEIALWGEDVILVQHSDIIRPMSELTGMDTCLSAFDTIPGRDVISLEGDRLGKMEDLHISPDGRLAGFSISRVTNGLADLLKQERKESYILPITTLHSFGKDVLILDMNRVRDMYPVTAVDEMEPEIHEQEVDFIPAAGKEEDHHTQQP